MTSTSGRMERTILSNHYERDLLFLKEDKGNIVTSLEKTDYYKRINILNDYCSYIQ